MKFEWVEPAPEPRPGEAAPVPAGPAPPSLAESLSRELAAEIEAMNDSLDMMTEIAERAVRAEPADSDVPPESFRPDRFHRPPNSG
ncbi:MULTISPECIES: hypothetical protein [Thermomonosporaceae]|uniref:hypothetical protein n=1 Tax=Thermomonosporaceae TaxID=2012 RepID=UPI00255A8F4D|nr:MULTISPECIES: hypothetical protein [Thermomonosporaceae]MDL4773658.1 hypothetical protein [Actinomadura xylanilytica]